MHDISIGTYCWSIPEEWDELKPKQFMRIYPIIQEGDTFKNRSRILMVLVNDRTFSSYFRKVIQDDLKGADWATHNINSLPPHIRADIAHYRPRSIQLLDLLNFLYENRPLKRDVSPLLRFFKLRGKEYLFPDKSLQDVTLHEWAHISVFLQSYLKAVAEGKQQKASDCLLSMVAILCRPKRSNRDMSSPTYNGYPRKPFNPELLKADRKRIEKRPNYVDFVVLDYILLCTQLLHRDYGKLWEGGEANAPSFGWQGVMMNIAEAGTFGDYDAVKRLNIHTACVYLMKQLAEAEYQAKKLEEK